MAIVDWNDVLDVVWCGLLQEQTGVDVSIFDQVDDVEFVGLEYEDVAVFKRVEIENLSMFEVDVLLVSEEQQMF